MQQSEKENGNRSTHIQTERMINASFSGTQDYDSFPAIARSFVRVLFALFDAGKRERRK